MTGASDAEARRFAGAFLSFLTWVHSQDASGADTDDIVHRTDGVTASFLKELLRRAVLESLHEHTPLRTVTAAHTSRALDDLLDSTQQATRSLLGVGNNPEDLPAGGGLGSLPPENRRSGWVSYGPMRGRPHRFGR